MRPQKLTTEHMLNTCALQFKTHGYAGTSMEMLAQACGLTKAAFYYHFPNKHALLMHVLEHTHLYLNQHLFAVVTASDQQPTAIFQHMHQRAVQFFSYEVTGCLIGIISVESHDISNEVVEKIQAIFQDWQAAFAQLFQYQYDAEQAQNLAKISIADYEGAILMTRLYDDAFYLEQVEQRILKLLKSI